MHAKRITILAHLGAGVALCWAAWRLHDQGGSPLQSWPIRIMLGMILLSLINNRFRLKRVTIPLGLISGFASALLIVTALPVDSGPTWIAIISSLKAASFFLCLALASLFQLSKWVPSNEVVIPLTPQPAAEQRPPIQPEPPITPAPVLPPKDTIIPKSERENAVGELVHLLEDFLFSRNKSAWSRPRALEISDVICQLFPDDVALLTLAADLAQYRPLGGSDRHSYPAMKPRIILALTHLRTLTTSPSFQPQQKR